MEIREMWDAVAAGQPIPDDAPLIVGQELIIADEAHDWYGALALVTAPTTGPEVSIVTVEADGTPGDPARLARTQLRIHRPAQPLRCELYASDRLGHCGQPAVRVAYAAHNPAIRILFCEAHPNAMNGVRPETWCHVTVEEYQAEHGPLVPDAPIIGGRKAPQD